MYINYAERGLKMDNEFFDNALSMYCSRSNSKVETYMRYDKALTFLRGVRILYEILLSAGNS